MKCSGMHFKYILYTKVWIYVGINCTVIDWYGMNYTGLNGNNIIYCKMIWKNIH